MRGSFVLSDEECAKICAMEMRRATLVLASLCAVSTAAGCGDSPPGKTYFERSIQPILNDSCVRGTSGCHDAKNNDSQYDFAAGNLDLTSFENVQKRRDALTPFGPYPEALLLIKAVGPKQLKLQYGYLADGTTPRFLDIDVQHSGGGSRIDVGSDAYFTLKNWLDNGATENGLKPPTPARTGDGACSTAVPPGFTKAGFVNTPQKTMYFDAFVSSVQPVLERHGCNAGTCHGAPQSDFYITCGTDDDQRAFNFSQAWSFVNSPVDDSQILKIPLAVAAGGHGHTGGDQFASTDADDFKALRTWASGVGVLDFAGGDPVKQFFKDNVQPILLQRGCSFQGCHSPQAANDFKLRSGTQGFFSAVALQKNYELLKGEFMAMEFADARRSRAVAKPILEDDPRIANQVGGMVHRGGAVLENQDGPSGPGSNPAACGAFNAATSSPFCTIQEWVTRERAAMPGQVTDLAMGQPLGIVYVKRTAAPTASRLEFDTFQGNADLMKATSTLGAGGSLGTAGAETSLLNNCGGALAAGPADVQAPEVAPDGNRIVFAARETAGDTLGIWIVDAQGNNCTRLTPNVAGVHNFDPIFSPDGQEIVFASTRGKAGPTKSRRRFLPQSDLWRVRLSGAFSIDSASYEQMTVLSNSEVGPAFMREGRMTMTTEKTSDGFYQLSGRRMNWDLTDYHPLLAQRKESLYVDGDIAAKKASIGYSSATDVREGADGNFMMILADVNQTTGAPMTPGAQGALATFNRSVGPFEAGRSDNGFLKSVRILDGALVYRNPVTAPDGTILVTKNFDLGSFNPRTLAFTPLFGSAGVRVDAQLIMKVPTRVMYKNRRQLVFGGSGAASDTTHALVHMPDAPMLFTLFTGNLRRGHPVDAFRSAKYLKVELEAPCPTAGCSANLNGIFEQRTDVGSFALADDGSVRVVLPAQKGLIFSLEDQDHKPVVKMTEEHQLGPGESVSMGVTQSLFDVVCAGCHGSVSGSELDIGVSADALTGASRSLSATKTPYNN